MVLGTRGDFPGASGMEILTSSIVWYVFPSIAIPSGSGAGRRSELERGGAKISPSGPALSFARQTRVCHRRPGVSAAGITALGMKRRKPREHVPRRCSADGPNFSADFPFGFVPFSCFPSCRTPLCGFSVPASISIFFWGPGPRRRPAGPLEAGQDPYVPSLVPPTALPFAVLGSRHL